MKNNRLLIIICSTFVVCLSIIVYYVNILPKSIALLQVNNLEAGVFRNIYDNLSHISSIKSTDKISIQSKNLKFVFNDSKELIKFRCEIQKNDTAYEIYADGERLYMNKILKKRSIEEINLNYLFKCFNRIDYTFLLDNLEKGDQYTFALYPQKSINNAGYIYNTREYGDAQFFIYKDNITKKLSSNKYHAQEDTLLFSLSAMKQSYKNNLSKGYHPIDKVFIIIVYKEKR